MFAQAGTSSSFTLGSQVHVCSLHGGGVAHETIHEMLPQLEQDQASYIFAAQAKILPSLYHSGAQDAYLRSGQAQAFYNFAAQGWTTFCIFIANWGNKTLG
jgi:hypothetical protein